MSIIERLFNPPAGREPAAGYVGPPRVPIILTSLLDRQLAEGVADLAPLSSVALQLEVNFNQISYAQQTFQSRTRAYGRTHLYFGTDDKGHNEDLIELSLSGSSGDIRHLAPVNRAKEDAPVPADYVEAQQSARRRLKSIYRLSQLTRQPKFIEVKGKRKFNTMILGLATPVLTPMHQQKTIAGTDNDGSREGANPADTWDRVYLKGYFSSPLLFAESAAKTGSIDYQATFVVVGPNSPWLLEPPASTSPGDLRDFSTINSNQ
jgi:hypothetical protein